MGAFESKSIVFYHIYAPLVNETYGGLRNGRLKYPFFVLLKIIEGGGKEIII